MKLNLWDVCVGINLPDEGIEIIKKYQETDTVFENYRDKFWKDRDACYEEILDRHDAQEYFLYFFCKLACEVWKKYKADGISEEIFFDTFSDIRIWCENSKRRFGNYGIREQGWLWRHLEMTIFRLGRLQFEKMESEWEVNTERFSLKKGDPVISIHIPEGGALDFEECKNSFKQAYAFWGTEFPYVCHSWLLGVELKEILTETSNIIRFQSFFDIVEFDYGIREGEERIFGHLKDDPKEYDGDTSLQIRAKEVLVNGGKLGSGLGVLIVPDK